MKNATASDIAKVAAKLGVSATVARLSLLGQSETTAEAHNAPQVGHYKFTPAPPKPAHSPPRRGAKPSGTRYNSRIVAAFFAEHGVPPPVREHAFAAPERKFRFDWAWPLLKVALEVEGGLFTCQAHGSIGGMLRDLEKYNLAASMGWRILRCVPDDLCRTETAELVKRTMAAGDL